MSVLVHPLVQQDIQPSGSLYLDLNSDAEVVIYVKHSQHSSLLIHQVQTSLASCALTD
jgi:hypothetical protein